MQKYWREVTDYLLLGLGTLLIATGLAVFQVPHRIAAGGLGGLATVLHYTLGVPVGLTILALNVPLFALGLRALGWRFAFRSVCGTVLYGILTDTLLALTRTPTQDALLAAIYGGLLVGLGLGLVFRAGGTTGGTDMAAQILRLYLPGGTSGRLLVLLDGVVIGLAALIFGLELALYALLSAFLAGVVIDAVQEGVVSARAALIISEHTEEIGSAILYRLNRGATLLEAQGLYTGKRRPVILCVVSRAEVSRLKALVADLDPRAFVIVAGVHEVLGEGFKEISQGEDLRWTQRRTRN
ncbi:MAG: YitT family protein [Clostridia bacterium]|nr:YitT family protein [Clostridia bacterium]